MAIFAYILSSVFLGLYLMIDRDRLRGGLFLVVPRTHHVPPGEVMINLETIVGGYIRGQAITSLFMAAFVFILLKACGVSSALTIAVFAGVADVLPYSGACSPWGPPRRRPFPAVPSSRPSCWQPCSPTKNSKPA